MNTADLSAPATADARNDAGPSAPAPTFGERRFAGITTGVFALVLAVLLWRHAPWRDELQAWAIVRDNADPRDLLAHLRYEGHPALWYAVLWLSARLTRSVAALQMVQWALAVGAAYIVVRAAPFPRLTRVLLIASFFPLIEYGVIARSYTLVWFLAVATLALVPRRHGLLSLGLGGALLANTTVLAIPFALALVAGVLSDRATQPADASRRERAFAAVAVAVGAAIALLTARPAPDAVHATMTLTDTNGRLVDNLSAPLRALVPLPASLTDLRDSHLLEALPAVSVLLAGLAVVGLAWVLRHRRGAVIVWLATALTVPAILYSRGLFPSPRFCGVLFVAAVTALWLARTTTGSGRAVTATATAIGAVGVVASLVAVLALWSTPFTGARATAQWLRDNDFANAPILCRTNYQCSSVGIRLDRPTEAMNQTGRFTYAVFRSGAPLADDSALFTTAAARATEEGTTVIVLTPERPTDPRGDVVAHFGDSIVADETYWITLVRPTA